MTDDNEGVGPSRVAPSRTAPGYDGPRTRTGRKLAEAAEELRVDLTDAAQRTRDLIGFLSDLQVDSRGLRNPPRYPKWRQALETIASELADDAKDAERMLLGADLPEPKSEVNGALAGRIAREKAGTEDIPLPKAG